MTRAESISFDYEKVVQLRKLVSQGEGKHLEFKRKVAFPEKVARELIAFANTDGGTLLVGVGDDHSIPGVKFPEEESLAIHTVLNRQCRPGLSFHESIIALADNRFVLQWRIPKSDRRPHYLVSNGSRSAFVRHSDQSIVASPEMAEIIRRSKSQKGGRFTYGEAEQKIIHYLDDKHTITLKEFAQLTGLNRFMASRKIIRLVLANVLKITATDKGDLYSRV